MAKCILEIENPRCIWAYPKGVKIMKSDGSFCFLISRKGTEGVYTELSEHELFELINKDEIE